MLLWVIATTLHTLSIERERDEALNSFINKTDQIQPTSYNLNHGFKIWPIPVYISVRIVSGFQILDMILICQYWG